MPRLGELTKAIEDEEEKLRQGTGAPGIERQKKIGRLQVRQRLSLLLDPKSPFLEIGLWAAWGMYPEWGDVPCAGVVAGIGQISGRTCMIVANDATVKAGAMFPQSIKKVLRAQKIAEQFRLPVVYLVDSAGVFLPLQDEIFPDEDDFGRIFRNNARMSAAGIPQLAAVMGFCVAGGAYLPVLCDILIMTEGSQMYLAGPALVKAAIGQTADPEELGGATMHSRVSGTADFHEPDDPAALERLRKLVGQLPGPNGIALTDVVAADTSRNDELLQIISGEGRVEYDIRKVIDCLVDEGSVQEYKADYGQAIVTSFARIGGHPVGIVANQHCRSKSSRGEFEFGGVVYPESAEKAARFVMNCNQDGIPLVFFQDVQGFMVGRASEQAGIIRSGAKLVNVVSNSVVPKLTVILGGSFGAGNYALCGKAYDPSLILAWPNAQYAVMGAQQAAETLLSLKIRDAERGGRKLDEVAIAELRQITKSNYEQKTDIRYGAARGWVDAIIAPQATRRWLHAALEMIAQRGTAPDFPDRCLAGMTNMATGNKKTTLKVANAQAFWGDRNDAASELLAQVPDIDYLTLDYLAEVSLSILAQQQARDPQAGYPKDFLELFTSLVPYWQAGGRCKLITNAGGFNPVACAEACAAKLAELGGPGLRIAAVTGDAVLDQLQNPQHADTAQLFRHLESGQSIDSVRSRLVTANAYVGAAPLIEALAGGADIVITGRVADPSLTVAACVYHFGWAADDWNSWAAATVAGHLLECGTQACGGISTDWLSMPDPANIGFPIVEMKQDGSFVVTKPPGSGGRVNLDTVAEQLLYEIGDPGRYLSPDLTVSFLKLQLEQCGTDRVQVTGAIGTPPTSSFKVSATYRDGFRAAGILTIFGRDAVKKGKRCGEIVLERMRNAGLTWRDTIVECIGAGACADGVFPANGFESLKEVAFRIGIEADDREVVDYFTRQIMPLVTAGPQGTTGYAEGRPKVHPIVRYWPCLIDRTKVIPRVTFVESPASSAARPATSPPKPVAVKSSSPSSTSSPAKSSPTSRKVLGDIAIARSGDKGSMANIGIRSRSPEGYDDLVRWLTAEKVAAFLAPLKIKRVQRFELPNLHAMNFLVDGVLARGLRLDVQGKTLGQVLLEMPLDQQEEVGDQDE